MGRTPTLPSLLTPNICMLKAPMLSVSVSLDLGTAAALTKPRDPSKISEQNSAPNSVNSWPFMMSDCSVKLWVTFSGCHVLSQLARKYKVQVNKYVKVKVVTEGRGFASFSRFPLFRDKP